MGRNSYSPEDRFRMTSEKCLNEADFINLRAFSVVSMKINGKFESYVRKMALVPIELRKGYEPTPTWVDVVTGTLYNTTNGKCYSSSLRLEL